MSRRRRRSGAAAGTAGPRTNAPAEVLELLCEGLVFRGDGLARHAGQVVFVPGLAPGDRARVAVVERRRGYLRGELVAVLTPGAARRAPRCPLCGDCGGCQWQHVDHAEQVVQKRALLLSALRALELPEERFLPAPEPWGYRRRCRLVWRRGAGRLQLGFRRARSRSIVDVEHCPLLVAVLNEAIAALRTSLQDGHAQAGQGTAVLLADGRGEGVQLSLRVDAGAQPAPDALLVGPIRGAAVSGEGVLREAGVSTLALDEGLRGRADAFAQANAAQDAALRIVVADAAGALRPRRLVELHAGVGNLTRLWGSLPDPPRVTAVELEGSAAELLRSAAGATAEVRAEAALVTLSRLVAAGEEVDLLVFDPPREGCAELVAPTLALRPASLLYLSCDPQTLARDLRALSAGGYRIERLLGIDMMPQTYHVECVALLRRVGL